MTIDQVREQLIGVLRTIQVNSGLACPPLDGATKPVEDLEKFNSKVWAPAIAMLALALGVDIADDINIFVAEDGERALSIDEAAALVCKIGKKPMAATEAAE